MQIFNDRLLPLNRFFFEIMAWMERSSRETHSFTIGALVTRGTPHKSLQEMDMFLGHLPPWIVPPGHLSPPFQGHKTFPCLLVIWKSKHVGTWQHGYAAHFIQ